jgi:ParB-like chromosome segregation protein Spo0J
MNCAESAKGNPLNLHPISKILPYTNNTKLHPESQVKQIAASIKEFGFTRPILLCDGGIKAGHGAMLAVQLLLDMGEQIYPAPGKAHGAEPFPDGMIPVVDATGWTEQEAKAYVIADNRLAELAPWDEKLLAIELEDIRLVGEVDFNLTGFDLSELEKVLDAGAGVGGEEQEKDYSEQNIEARFDVLIECSTEERQTEILNILESEGIQCRALIS